MNSQPHSPFVLLLSGSLRANSANHLLLRAVEQCFLRRSQHIPQGNTSATTPFAATLDLIPFFYQNLGLLPHFNPDLDTESAIPEVANFRSYVLNAQAVVISSPEYAFGMPGTLKNALDWLVKSGELDQKPVALFNVAATGGDKAGAQLEQTLTVMSARVCVQHSFHTAHVKRDIAVDGQISSGEMAELVQKSVALLVSNIL